MLNDLPFFMTFASVRLALLSLVCSLSQHLFGLLLFLLFLPTVILLWVEMLFSAIHIMVGSFFLEELFSTMADYFAVLLKYHYHCRRNEFESGRGSARPARSDGKIFVVPVHFFWLYRYN